jgi:hypothetical protein
MLATLPVSIFQTGAAGAILFGGGLCCIGLSILLLFVFNLVTKGYCLLTRVLWRAIKKMFI